MTIPVLAGACLMLALCVSDAATETTPSISGVKAGPEALLIRVSGSGQPAKLVELRPYETYDAGADHPVLWEGKLTAREIEVPRFEERRDRLYSKFQLIAADTGRPICPPHYVDDLAALPAWEFDMPWPESIKGVTCPVDIEDLSKLGVKYTDTNITLGGLLNWRDENPAEVWEVDGEQIGINLAYVHRFDEQIKRMNEAGINVTLILLNPVPTAPDPGNPLIHPRTDLANAPMHLAAFNLTDEPGLRHYRAAMEYLAHRYSRPDGEHGWVSGYVIGNELQAHWVWHNTGRISLEELARDYANQLRIAWLAVRRYHTGVRIYASMEHHWTVRHDKDPMKAVRGDEFLERVNAIVKSEGDFPWHVAFHPYPESLWNPRFWNDKTAALGFDTHKITFKNLEVLPAFLGQERFLYRGARRRIILSEQGFHCPDGPEGEKIQAAAYAYAYHKVSHIPEIDSFILHRHVDHRGEGGLRLGLWTCKQDGPNPCSPDRKRLIYDVFRLADTDEWRQAFEFAKPIIGIEDWDEALPYTGPIPVESGAFATPINPEALVYDLRANMSGAERVGCGDWRPAHMTGEDGRLYPTIFQHPPLEADGVGDATYTISLPQEKPGHGLALRFSTALSHERAIGDGVRFGILLNGQDVWSAKKAPGEKPTAYAVDLSAHAGRTVKLTLRIDPLGNATADWANWVQPAIVFEPR